MCQSKTQALILAEDVQTHFSQALLLSRMHVMLLHRYHNSVVAPMPDRLRSIMLASGVTTVECAVALETLPELKSW
jgi:hypothetical protein